MPSNPSAKKKSAGSKIIGMPKPLFWVILVVVLVAIGGTAYYFVNAQQVAAAAATANQATIQTATARTGNIILRASGTGTLVAAAESNLGFQTSGTLITLNVQVGSQVKAGDLIAQLDSSDQTLALTQAQQALNQLTSPAAIATAQQAVVTTQTNLTNAQNILNADQTAGSNQGANNNAYATLTLAKNKLNAAQLKYDPVSGQPLTDPAVAKLYQNLYSAKQAYATALAAYNSTSATSNPLTLSSDQATVALDQAQVTEAQNLLTALTGGTVPANATGTGLNAINQAKLNLQTAQNNLANTNLNSPISGTILTVSNAVGDTINSGKTFVTIADMSQSELTVYMDPLDFSNIKIGYHVNVVFDALPTQTYTGKVTQITPQLVTISGNSVVEGVVILDAKQATGVPPLTLPLGVTASVDIIAAQANNVILVPVQALQELSPNNYSVYLMVNGKPTLRAVTVGLQDGTFAEIKTGLKAGDVVSTATQAVATP
jgi:RND family efflux transporter MFP subunit